MTEEELYKDCKKMLLEGDRFREVYDFLKYKNVDEEMRGRILKKLKSESNVRKVADQHVKTDYKTGFSLVTLVLSILAIILGTVIYLISKEAGLIFVASIVLWFGGGLAFIIQIFRLIASMNTKK